MGNDESRRGEGKPVRKLLYRNVRLRRFRNEGEGSMCPPISDCDANHCKPVSQEGRNVFFATE